MYTRQWWRDETYADEKRKAQIKVVRPGDQVMVQQKKSTVKTPWDPSPYTVTKVQGS